MTTDVGVDEATLRRFDASLKSLTLKRRISRCAGRVGLNPGLLAAVALAENSPRIYTRQTGKLDTYKVGADDLWARWFRIKRIRGASELRFLGRPIRHANDGVPPRTVITREFPARQAVLVVALYLKDRENTIRRLFKEEGGDFDALPPLMRFFMSRLAYNPGRTTLRTRVKHVRRGVDVYDRSGPRAVKGRPRVRRAATIHAARAMYLSVRVFGVIPMQTGLP
jgi:hypothetical protein